MKTNKDEVDQATVRAIGSRIAEMQKRQGQIKTRLSALDTEESKLTEEQDSLRAEHATLLRQFDAAAMLP